MNEKLNKACWRLTPAEAIELELPHIKYVIDCLHAQNLSAGALQDIYLVLKMSLKNTANEQRPGNAEQGAR